ncbi:hypothetical protein E1263_08655 [Kribbella antibiotica]|uniref:Uncharacterized protein n=1 Tax=Kribbella antibiotica TaxID=190195 RepID=A0A4R4ZQ28_9ACTN|nr:hypothetical protein E1263_08655 [Kribbella antibiotica]
MKVMRGSRMVDWRDAPTDHANAYAVAFGLLYPHDLIRAEEISRHEAAYPRNRPYDPHDYARRMI